MKELELRRHAKRDPDQDRLSDEGRAQAQDLGREAAEGWAAVFVSPAQRAAETAAHILRGAGSQLPPEHRVVPGLAGQDPSGGSPEAMAAGIRALLLEVPDGGRGLAISHSPFVERAAFGLTGDEVAPMRECEGILVTAEDDHIGVAELRLPG
jgi:phosphohistidine phosphatase SixA